MLEHKDVVLDKRTYLLQYMEIFLLHRKPSQAIIKCCIQFLDTFFESLRNPEDQKIRDELKQTLIRLSDSCNPKFTVENEQIFELIARDPTLTKDYRQKMEREEEILNDVKRQI